MNYQVYVKKREISAKPATDNTPEGQSDESFAQPAINNAAGAHSTTDAKVSKDVYEKTKKAYEVFRLACGGLDTVCGQCQGIACDNANASSGTQKMKMTRNWYLKVRARLEDVYGGALPDEVERELPRPRTC